MFVSITMLDLPSIRHASMQLLPSDWTYLEPMVALAMHASL